MFKNVASQSIALFAFTTADGVPKSGDAANITAYVSKDFGAVTVLADTSATEMDATNAKGWYLFAVAQGETNADAVLFTGKSATAGISVVGVLIYTLPPSFTAHVAQTGDAFAVVNSGTFGNSALKTLVDTLDNFVDTEVADIQARLPAALVGGRMDSSTGAMAANVLTAAATAADFTTEIQAGLATAAALTVVDDFLDTEVAAILAAVDTEIGTIVTATGAAAIRAALGLASANLDTQLTAIDDLVDTEVAAIKAKTDLIPAAPAAVGDIPSAASIATAVLTTAMTESYAANGAAPTLAQAHFEQLAMLTEKSVAGVTLTTKKRDGATTAATYTLDSATVPTAISRTT